MRFVVVGGGVSGLVSSVLLARQGHDVTVLEADKRIGKKISVSGNGRCNLDNLGVSRQCYNDTKIVNYVFENVSVQKCIDFWHSLGIITYSDDKGRVYPITDNSNTVVDCLRYELQKLDVKVLCEQRVIAVDVTKNTYVVKTEQGGKFVADKVILACGGNSQSKFNGYNLVPKQYLTHFQPSLTPIAVKSPFQVINGLRQKCAINLVYKGNVVANACGEVLFREYGVSGICIMDLSAYLARIALKGSDITEYSLDCDLLPSISENELKQMLYARVETNTHREQFFYGILHNKLAEVILKYSGISKEVQYNDIDKIVKAIKHFVYKVDKLCGFQYSQVTAGGVDEKYIDKTLTLPCGIAVLGEMLNVDGICGGYNIHFATASAIYYCNTLTQHRSVK